MYGGGLCEVLPGLIHGTIPTQPWVLNPHPLKVQALNSHILTQNLYQNCYYPNLTYKYLKYKSLRTWTLRDLYNGKPSWREAPYEL